MKYDIFMQLHFKEPSVKENLYIMNTEMYFLQCLLLYRL